MAVKKKIYAVAVGRKPGIYSDWPSVKMQVDGFGGAKYKGFSNREAALAWLNNSGLSAPEPTTPPQDVIIVYTDGGAHNNPGPGGYGCILSYKDLEKEFSGGFRMTTNNRMELMACIVALREIKDKTIPIILHSDSSYVVNGISKGWAAGWRKNDWIKSDKKPAINPDLWAELLELSESLKITFKWVKGHAGNPLNERCDQLAVASSGKADLPVDSGYESRN